MRLQRCRKGSVLPHESVDCETPSIFFLSSFLVVRCYWSGMPCCKSWHGTSISIRSPQNSLREPGALLKHSKLCRSPEAKSNEGPQKRRFTFLVDMQTEAKCEPQTNPHFQIKHSHGMYMFLSFSCWREKTRNIKVHPYNPATEIPPTIKLSCGLLCKENNLPTLQVRATLSVRSRTEPSPSITLNRRMVPIQAVVNVMRLVVATSACF